MEFVVSFPASVTDCKFKSKFPLPKIAVPLMLLILVPDTRISCLMVNSRIILPSLANLLGLNGEVVPPSKLSVPFQATAISVS